MAVVLALLVPAVSAQKADLQKMLKEIHAAGSEAKPEQIHRVANLGTRAAMEGLLQVYDRVASIYLRREVVFALAKFDGIKDAQEPAIEKIANVATTSKQPELRTAAINALSGCDSLGKHFLAVIVQSDVADQVREQALEAHVRKAGTEDLAFYEKIWKPLDEKELRKLKKKSRKKSKKGAASDDVPRPELEAIRVIAFEAAADKLPEATLIEVLQDDKSKKMRHVALEALHATGSKKTESLALKLFERVDEPGMTRTQAAEILASLRGAKLSSAFIKLAKKKAVTPDDLRRAMARLIVDMNDKTTNAKVAKLVGRGAPHEKIFAIYATMHLDDAKLLKKIRKGLSDRSFDVRRATARSLVERGDEESIPDLMKMLDKAKAPEDRRIAIESISAFKKNDAEWRKRLVEFAASKERDVRNGALEVLAALDKKVYVPLFVSALQHPDWTTRLLAIESLEKMRRKEGVEGLVDCLAREQGRLKIAAADALWSLTGKEYEKNASLWRTWWDAEGKGFEVLTSAELNEATEARELRRLKETTVAAQFFGIKITSHRVLFVLDVSGSMVEMVQGRYEGGREATRLEVAKRELLQCIESLEPEALFNIFVFSGGVERWAKENIGGLTKQTREQAKTWIERLGAGGATNIYDALKMAFDDPDVDTIYLLSDGEPTAGAITDPARIREDVKFWNEHRKIKIHAIAIGGSLQVLEHLAKDSGGRYVTFR